MSNMRIERGSTWNKWDFHVHTPYSILNNQFGFDPDPTCSKDVDEFDDYVKALFKRAIEEEIVGIGITDYFSIDGYKRIRCQYLNDPEKMASLFPNPDDRDRISEMCIFPNIEFRIPTFIGKGANSVNYHVIFSPELTPDEIELYFLGKIQIEHSYGEKVPLCRSSIELVGRDYKKHNSASGSDYHVGLDKITVDEKEVIDILDDLKFKDKYMILIPVDEDLSSVPWNGRDSISRKILYQQCHCLLTSNENTRMWALGKYGVEAQIEEFGSLKPCLWGSDAHSYDRLFRPCENRYCWIKAEPTYEGLQQIRYEPGDRVAIQQNKPDEKDPHQIIDYIIFDNEDFQVEPIYLNEGLTAIIGGKSTGKSILLRHIAKCIDARQVTERESGLAGNKSKLDASATVVWKDGTSDERKIIYIPQAWLNQTVDESTGNSQLNKMLQNILQQQAEIGTASIYLKTEIEVIMDSLRHHILDYVAARKSIEECDRYLRENGRCSAFQTVIDTLEIKRAKLSSEAGITDDELQRYSNLQTQIHDMEQSIENIDRERKALGSIHHPWVYLPSLTTIEHDEMPKYNLESAVFSKKIINDAIANMNSAVIAIWEPTIKDAIKVLDTQQSKIQKDLSSLQVEYKPLHQKVEKSEQLKAIDAQLLDERRKLQKSKEQEDKRRESQKKANDYRSRIIQSRTSVAAAYNKYQKRVTMVPPQNTNLQFEAEILYKKKELFDTINSLFNNRSFRLFRDKYNYDISDYEDFVVDDDLFVALWNAIDDSTISFKGGNTLQTVLERLFSDWYYVHYTVKSDNDTINHMSPGKKALVLLEMIVNMESSKCPILIDQPEDDLDNRSIYSDLVTYLKNKKHERQIIVVTHNANAVIGSDAEEVIIANQAGVESPNREKRFEYRCGAIENVTPLLDENGVPYRGVLNEKGVQEQICDILEGGKEAFNKRKNKYLGIGYAMP